MDTKVLPPFKLERYFAQYEFDAPFLLCSSDCESVAVEDLLALEPGAESRLRKLWLGYTESAGSPTLREDIAQIYESISSEDVIVCSGAEEGIFLWMQAALSPGDHVIVHTPCYQSLQALPVSLGCSVTTWQAREEEGWRLDLEELRRLLLPNTRAIILNTPHNPTGYLMAKADFVSLCELAQERNILLFSDEVYRESEHDPINLLPAACDLSDAAVSLGVLSKTYGLPGLRIGWIATHNRHLLKRIAEIKDYTTICNSAPSEFLGEIALRHRHQLAERNRAIITDNLTVLDDFFIRYADLFWWQMPQAGAIAFPKLLQGDIVVFCDQLVKEAGVLLLPGNVYGDTANHFRIGFGRRNLPQALAQLELFLKSRKE